MDGQVSVRGENAAKAVEVLTDSGRCQTIPQANICGSQLLLNPCAEHNDTICRRATQCARAGCRLTGVTHFLRALQGPEDEGGDVCLGRQLEDEMK